MMKRFYFLLLFIVVLTKIVKFLYHCWLCLFFFIDPLTGILSFFRNKKEVGNESSQLLEGTT